MNQLHACCCSLYFFVVSSIKNIVYTVAVVVSGVWCKHAGSPDHLVISDYLSEFKFKGHPPNQLHRPDPPCPANDLQFPTAAPDH